MSASLTFPSVTPSQWQAVKDAAASNGITIVGVSGTASAHGCTVRYQWEGWPGCESAALNLALLHAPLFCGGIALGKLHDLVEQVLTKNQPPVAPAESGT